ncbi:hypothetical protein DTO10_23395 [Peribacillus butanolivorans]|uniref:Transposase n=1 Tax=Peribacillus butanolivorans TaxID=421767 RepID=A0ABN5N6J6_9BACI|nr:hypothetical protein DTO10_23395 [Peribacillus butanolivorans]
MEAAIRAIEKHKKLTNHKPGNGERTKYIEQINTLKRMAEREYRYTYGVRVSHLDKIINDSHKQLCLIKIMI